MGSRTQVTTDEHGYVQAELSHLQELHFTPAQGGSCQVTLPQNVQPIHGVLLYRQPLVCAGKAVR